MVMFKKFSIILPTLLLCFAPFSASAQMDQTQSQAGHAYLPSDVPGQHSALRLLPPEEMKSAAVDEQQDHRAVIFGFEGIVRILKNGASEWISAKKGMVLEPKDQMILGDKSRLDFAYDSKMKNRVRLETGTKAEFLNIEPTVIRLESGKIFNALNELPAGTDYQIQTPTAIVTAHENHFDVWFDDESRQFSAGIFPLSENSEGSILIQDLLSDGQKGREVKLPEGQEIRLAPEQLIEEAMARGIPASRLEKYQK